MKKVYLLILAALASLLFSCASGTNQTDDSVGYITFGSSRVAAGLSSFGINASELTNLELTGTHGGSTKKLGSWSTAGEAEGTEIEVQKGSWTLTLKANYNNNYFLSTETITIKPDTTNAVHFKMIYAGKPASQASNGDIIFANGYAESRTSPFLAGLKEKSTPEAIAVVSAGTVYGIRLTQGPLVPNENIYDAVPAGWSVPSLSILQSIYDAKTTIVGSFPLAGSSNYISTSAFWASNTHPVDGQGYFLMGSGSSGYTTVTQYYLMLVKQY